MNVPGSAYRCEGTLKLAGSHTSQGYDDAIWGGARARGRVLLVLIASSTDCRFSRSDHTGRTGSGCVWNAGVCNKDRVMAMPMRL